MGGRPTGAAAGSLRRQATSNPGCNRFLNQVIGFVSSGSESVDCKGGISSLNPRNVDSMEDIAKQSRIATADSR